MGRASIRICGLGQFELRVNGRKVGDDLLEPAWTNYRKTCLYLTRDLTSQLKTGQNIVEVLLGNGMYHVGSSKRYKKFKGSFGPLKLIARLDIAFEDGTSETIVTDESWRVAPGPITFSCIYGGEDYDAQREPPTDWSAAQLVEGPGGVLVEQTSAPIRVIRSIKPIKVTEPAPGKRVYDLGQNFSGIPRLSARGFANQKIRLLTSELLDEHGLVSQRNSGAPVWFEYTLKGSNEVETWSPRFTYTGFRYVQAEGDLGALLDVRGDFIYSSAKVVGKFRCSNDLLNRVHELILNAIRSNLQHVITDCPHREKLGWLEQTHLMGEAILFNFDAAALYRKLSGDMRDAQHASGMVPTIAPQYTSFEPPWDVFNDSPEWGSACVLNPWLVYQYTGDKAILEENYDSMKRYVEYLGTRAVDHIIDYGLGDWYDIGPGDPGYSKLTSKALTATSIYLRCLTIMSSVSALLGRTEESSRFTSFGGEVRSAFLKRLFDAEHRRFDTGSQTASAMPLALDLVEAQDRQAVLEQLIADIRAHDNHITAGDIGFRYVIHALAEHSRSDVIFDLLTRADPPSYGAQLAGGATTLTEAWDANPKVSQNHLMLGHAEIWFYQSLAGIRFDLSQPTPDRRIVIKPAFVGDVRWVEASYESAAGRIAIRWERSDDEVTIDLTVPTAVTLELPNGSRVVEAGTHRIVSSLT